MLVKMKKGLIAMSYLTTTWSLLLWLHLHIEPNVFAHMVAIPALMFGTGLSAWLLYHKPCCQ